MKKFVYFVREKNNTNVSSKQEGKEREEIGKEKAVLEGENPEGNGIREECKTKGKFSDKRAQAGRLKVYLKTNKETKCEGKCWGK